VIIGPCDVVTGGPEPLVLADGAVRVVGAHIAQVGTVGSIAAAYPGETVWPANGRVLLPGLVNTHAHLARHLARGLDVAAVGGWERYDRALSPEDVRASVTAALVEGLRHGVTTVCDFHRSGACLDLSLSEVVTAARRAGVRVATCYGASERDTPLERAAAFEESETFARDLARRREGGAHGLVGIQAATLDGLDTLLDEALEVGGGGLPVHVDLRLDATPGERPRAGARWHDGAPALWAHADRAPRALLARLQERGDTFTAVGAGGRSALAREVDLGWGSGVGVHAPPVLDGAAADVGRAAGPEAGESPAARHYRRLFVHGARWAAPYFGAGLGTIAAGAPADLVLIDYRPATELSSRTLHAHLASGLLRAPVSGVMVAGEVVLDHGALVSLDEGEVVARARECARRVWARL
jgi:cytosine/adenosine deaminase-related metal-dependent hydrolase